MGRLHQKKSPSAKKKAKQKAERRAAALTKGGGAAVKEGRSKSISLPKKASGQPRAVSKIQKQNVFQKSIQFLREVKVELKKVTWPSKKQTIGSTVVAIVLVIIISLFLGVVDMSLTSLISLVLQ
jgi:preprotein translocase subunit SecE